MKYPNFQGDSGGPVVYIDKRKRFTLAGIVAQGFGCGRSDFPGIYMAANYGYYLAWIKRTAFMF